MIRSIDRAFKILDVISRASAGLRVNEIVRHVDLPPTTVSRMLQTLEALDVVTRIHETHRFILGKQLVRLSLEVPYRVSIQALARPYLEELAELVGETVNLCLPEAEGVVHIDQVVAKKRLGFRDWVGQRVPLHCDSSGKLFLAFGPEEQVERYVSKSLEALTPHTITESEQLRTELLSIREQGYAWALEELELGLAGISAPILSKDGYAVASVNVAGPTSRLTGDQREEVTHLTVDAARRVTELWQLYVQDAT